LVQNCLLGALPREDLERLQGWMHLVHLGYQQTIHWAGEPLRQVYFPTTAILTLGYTLQNGSTMELAMVGREGLSCPSALLGVASVRFDTVVQVPGMAYRVPTLMVPDALRVTGPAGRELQHYIVALFTQIAHRITCARHHTVQQRLASYLLMLRDRVGTG